jgi:hypothetical protein
MSYHGDIRLGDTIDIKFVTTAVATGAPTQLAGTPVISAYVGNGTTEITAGITLSVDFDSRTGLNNVRVVASSGNGYATATNVQLVITTGTVGGTSVVGYVVGTFSIEARSAVMPTTAARTLDVSAGGEAGVDWANVGSPTAAVNLSSTTVNLTNTATTVTNQLTAAQIATGVWQDATAGDFTTASSIGKSLYTGNIVPGAAGGHFIAGTNAATSITTALTANVIGNVTGNLSGSVGSVTGAVGSVTGAVGSVTGAVGSVTAGVSLAANAITAAATAADFTTEIQAGLATAANLATVDTVVDAIKVKTDQLVFTIANQVDSNVLTGGGSGLDAAGTRAALGLASANLDTQLADLPTNAELATALGTSDDAVLAQIALVKAKTDPLTFTKANELDANIQSVNDVTVAGTGALGDEWGP